MAADINSGSEKDSQGSPYTSQQKVLKILSAIARGDATSEDIVTALRNEGVSSLDELVTVLVQAGRAHRDDSRPPPSPINLQRSSKPTPPDLASSIVHPVPELPFVLNGALYDPEDIQRFNGQELHFVPAASRDHIIVVDDRDVMVKWWQLSYLSAIGEATKHAPASQDMSILRDHVPGILPWAEFHEDVNFQGDIITLYPFSGYNDLTELSQGLFEGDWNDEISSVRMHTPEHDITRHVTLYEHTHWQGSTLTLFVSHGHLFDYGWNDRASSIEFI